MANPNFIVTEELKNAMKRITPETKLTMVIQNDKIEHIYLNKTEKETQEMTQGIMETIQQYGGKITNITTLLDEVGKPCGTEWNLDDNTLCIVTTYLKNYTTTDLATDTISGEFCGGLDEEMQKDLANQILKSVA